MNRVHKEILLDNNQKRITQFIYTPEAGDKSPNKEKKFRQYVQKYAQDSENTFQIFLDITTDYNMIVVEQKY